MFFSSSTISLCMFSYYVGMKRVRGGGGRLWKEQRGKVKLGWADNEGTMENKCVMDAEGGDFGILLFFIIIKLKTELFMFLLK